MRKLVAALLWAAAYAQPQRPPLPRRPPAAAIREAYLYAFATYARDAWGSDWVRPLARASADESAAGPLGQTIASAVDGMWFMGFDGVVKQCGAWAATEFDVDAHVSVRTRDAAKVLGGLLAAGHLSGDTRFLEAAKRLGDRLLPAYGASPTGPPYARIFDLKEGVVGVPKQNVQDSESLVAGLVELKALAKTTSKQRFARASDRQLDALFAMKGWTLQGSLAPARASVAAGAFEDSSSGRCSAGEGGAEIYEALVARGTIATDELGRKALRLATRAAVASLAFIHQTENGTVAADLLQGEKGPAVFHQRACALPGFLARTRFGNIAGPLDFDPALRGVAHDLVMTCIAKALETPTGLAPARDQSGSRVGDLRPETAASLFFMRRATSDSVYADLGYELFKRVNESARVDNGAFVVLDDVRTGGKRDEMPPHIFETLKFLYLLVLENETRVPVLDEEWVWSSGGHALPVFNGSEVLDASNDDLNATVVIIKHVGQALIPHVDVHVADALERFAATATSAGHAFDETALNESYRLVASTRPAGRPLSGSAMIAGFAPGIIPHGEAGNASVWGVSNVEGPARFISRVARALVSQGLPASRDFVATVHAKLCELRPCAHYGDAPRYDLPQNLTVAADPLGSLTVEAWMEPAEAIEHFARTAAARGQEIKRDSCVDMLMWFCRRRRCVRQTMREDRKALVLLSDGREAIAQCEFWSPPEWCAEVFKDKLVKEGVPADDAIRAGLEVLKHFCETMECGQRLHTSLSLDIWDHDNGTVGSAACGPLVDPADCVEKLFRGSYRVGFRANESTSVASMTRMMRWFCKRRACFRPLAPSVALSFRNDTLVVRPWDEPRGKLREFAQKFSDRNEPLSTKEMKMLSFGVCSARPGWCVTLPKTVGVEVAGVGEATCRPWEEPADVLDALYNHAKRVDIDVTDLQLKTSLELMCAERNCDRRKVKSAAKLFFMHPGKTAGRAIQDAVSKTDKIFVLGHDDRCDGSRKPCYVVLRDPRERLVSALAFKQQGGEWRGERLLGNTCHGWLMGKNLSTILSDVDALDRHCEFFQASSKKATHCVFRPLQWWINGHENNINFICFPDLKASLAQVVAPFCANATCALPKRNPSNHSFLYGGNASTHGAALDAFAEKWYAPDLALFRRHCGQRLL